VDLAYDDDTYEEDEIYQQHLTALKAKRERKRKLQRIERGEDVSDEEDEEEKDEKEVEKKKNKEEERDRIARLAPEKEYGMHHIDSSLSSEKYADQIMIFGYMTLFVASFPGAVFLGFIAYFLEVRGTLRFARR
jgi:hypothetical protein